MKRYATDTVANVEEYIKKHGTDGVKELNSLASAHEIVLEADGQDKYSSGGGCDINDGKLRLLFNKSNLGNYTSDASQYIDKAVNEASRNGSTVSFTARQAITKDFDAKIGAVEKKFLAILQLPDISLEPNWEANFQEVKKKQTGDSWEKEFGKKTLAYFEALAEALQNSGFSKDDLLREGWAEAVEKNRIVLKVCDTLKKMRYNEVWLEGGVAYIQVRPVYLRDPSAS